MTYKIEFQNRRAWLKDVNTGEGKLIKLSDLIAVGSPVHLWTSLANDDHRCRDIEYVAMDSMPWRANSFHVLRKDTTPCTIPVDNYIIQYYRFRLF